MRQETEPVQVMNVVSDAWLPKSVILLREYTFDKFVCDLIAGVTVGLVALPLAMAFAIASGVPPQAGIYCAIVTGFLISALGGSSTQIGGPAGVLLVLMGVTGLGALVKYFPRPVVVGFTNGIAILIASTQIRDFFGIRMEHVPGDFFHRMGMLAENFHTLNWAASLVGIALLAVMIICVR